MATRSKVNPAHYVDNKMFTQAIIEHNLNVKEAVAKEQVSSERVRGGGDVGDFER